MGPSGSGKSTLMHILAGLDQPVGLGHHRRQGDHDPQGLRTCDEAGGAHRVRLPVLRLLPMLNAEENITLPLAIAGEEADQAFFDELISSVGLEDAPMSPVRALRRPAAAGRDRARARLPAGRRVRRRADGGSLDSHTGNEILELLRHSVEQLGQTIVMVTHESRAAIGDRVLYLADGVIVKSCRSVPARDHRGDGGDLRGLTRFSLKSLPDASSGLPSPRSRSCSASP